MIGRKSGLRSRPCRVQGFRLAYSRRPQSTFRQPDVSTQVIDRQIDRFIYQNIAKNFGEVLARECSIVYSTEWVICVLTEGSTVGNDIICHIGT